MKRWFLSKKWPTENFFAHTKHRKCREFQPKIPLHKLLKIFFVWKITAKGEEACFNSRKNVLYSAKPKILVVCREFVIGPSDPDNALTLLQKTYVSSFQLLLSWKPPGLKWLHSVCTIASRAACRKPLQRSRLVRKEGESSVNTVSGFLFPKITNSFNLFQPILNVWDHTIKMCQDEFSSETKKDDFKKLCKLFCVICHSSGNKSRLEFNIFFYCRSENNVRSKAKHVHGNQNKQPRSHKWA